MSQPRRRRTSSNSKEAEPLPAGSEQRLADFTELLTTGTASAALFDAVTTEMRSLLNAGVASLLRYEADGTATVLAASSDPGTEVSLLSHLTLERRSAAGAVFSSRCMARLGELEGPPGSVVVPPDNEGRMAQFTQLVATAISNAASRAQLAASRARIVMTADETRPRIERNLHDGIQQRLATLALELRTVNDAVSPERAALLAAMSHADDELISILDELREISRGVHPAILSQNGLSAALRSAREPHSSSNCRLSPLGS